MSIWRERESFARGLTQAPLCLASSLGERGELETHLHADSVLGSFLLQAFPPRPFPGSQVYESTSAFGVSSAARESSFPGHVDPTEPWLEQYYGKNGKVGDEGMKLVLSTVQPSAYIIAVNE